MTDTSDIYHCRKGIMAIALKDPDKHSAWFRNNMEENDRREIFTSINNAVIRVHKLTILVYQLIEAYYLHCYYSPLPFGTSVRIFPIIDETLIRHAISLISMKENAGGRKSKIEKEFEDFFHDHFEATMPPERISRSNLGPIIEYAITTIHTAINNNITIHFVKRLFGLINKVLTWNFRHHYPDYSNSLTRPQFKAWVRSEGKPLKDYLIDPIKYPIPDSNPNAKLIRSERPLLIPKIVESVPLDLAKDPQKFLPCMIHMNSILEHIGLKQFHCFPLRSEIIPKQIDLDTKALVRLLHFHNKKSLSEGAGAIGRLQTWLWQEIFDFEDSRLGPNPLFQPRSGYRFDFAIKTDGVSISVRFKKGITPEKLGPPIVAISSVPNLFASSIPVPAVLPNPFAASSSSVSLPTKKPGKSKYSDQPQPRKTAAQRKAEKLDEFPYLESLISNRIEFERVRRAHKVYIDPGKSNLIFCIDDDNKVLRYTRKQRINETEHFKMQKTRLKWKNLPSNPTTALETMLGRDHNSKTCDLNRFLAYVRAKNEANEQMFPWYEEFFLRQMKLRSYLNTQRSERKLVQRIKDTYGWDADGNPREVVLIYGDQNVGPQMRGVISTPMVGLKRMLAKEFMVLNFDEFRTSCLDYVTSARNENAIFQKEIRKGGQRRIVRRRLHGVLVSYRHQNSDRTSGNPISIYRCRDRNAACNIRKLTQLFFSTHMNRRELVEYRPMEYRRSFKLGEKPDLQRLRVFRSNQNPSVVKAALGGGTGAG